MNLHADDSCGSLPTGQWHGYGTTGFRGVRVRAISGPLKSPFWICVPTRQAETWSLEASKDYAYEPGTLRSRSSTARQRNQPGERAGGVHRHGQRPHVCVECAHEASTASPSRQTKGHSLTVPLLCMT